MYLVNDLDTQMVKSVALVQWQYVTARARIRITEHSRGRNRSSCLRGGFLWFPVLIFPLEKQA